MENKKQNPVLLTLINDYAKEIESAQHITLEGTELGGEYPIAWLATSDNYVDVPKELLDKLLENLDEYDRMETFVEQSAELHDQVIVTMELIERVYEHIKSHVVNEEEDPFYFPIPDYFMKELRFNFGNLEGEHQADAVINLKKMYKNLYELAGDVIRERNYDYFYEVLHPATNDIVSKIAPERDKVLTLADEIINGKTLHSQFPKESLSLLTNRAEAYHFAREQFNKGCDWDLEGHTWPEYTWQHQNLPIVKDLVSTRKELANTLHDIKLQLVA